MSTRRRDAWWKAWRSPIARRVTERCAVALARIGKSGLPALLSICTNSAVPGRVLALDALAYLGQDAPQAGPVLIKCMREKDRRVSEYAAGILAELQLKFNVSELTNFLVRPDPDGREFAALALAQFGQVATPAVPQLQVLMTDPDANVRARARFALKSISPEALTNAPPERQ
jgi:HEAT repeat protein